MTGGRSTDGGTDVSTDGIAPVDAPRRAVAPRWWGAVIGLLALGVGLALAEFATGFSRVLRSPVVSVGDRVIDHVPIGVRQWAITTFGTTDKLVLVWSIAIILGIVAIAAGIAAVRNHLGVGLALVGVVGAVGIPAATTGRQSTGNGAIPSIFATLGAAGALWVGRRITQPRVPVDTRPIPARRKNQAVPVPSRRRFLLGTGALAVVAIGTASLGRSMQHRFNSTLERAGVRPPLPKQPLPPPPADPALVTSGLSALITPIDSFYRIDTALRFPSVSLDSWKLKITGLVDKPLTFTYDELLARELIERDITMSCVSNEVGGDLVGNARWVGCRLDTLLTEAGIGRTADQIMGVSIDGFTAGFPVAALDGRDAIIAVGMNGEVLPVKNGFPARLVVPGLYGYVSAVKWLSEIRLTRFDREEGYWVPRGWAAKGPIKTQSRIDRPTARVAVGPNVIAGVAWAPTRGIAKVEVQVDGGTWSEATIGPVLSNDTWVQWWIPWNATSGRHQLRCRATDGAGNLHTQAISRVDPDGATGWHTVNVST